MSGCTKKDFSPKREELTLTWPRWLSSVCLTFSYSYAGGGLSSFHCYFYAVRDGGFSKLAKRLNNISARNTRLPLPEPALSHMEWYTERPLEKALSTVSKKKNFHLILWSYSRSLCFYLLYFISGVAGGSSSTPTPPLSLFLSL